MIDFFLMTGGREEEIKMTEHHTDRTTKDQKQNSTESKLSNYQLIERFSKKPILLTPENSGDAFYSFKPPPTSVVSVCHNDTPEDEAIETNETSQKTTTTLDQFRQKLNQATRFTRRTQTYENDRPEFSSYFSCALFNCTGCRHSLVSGRNEFGFPFELVEEIGKGGFASYRFLLEASYTGYMDYYLNAQINYNSLGCSIPFHNVEDCDILTLLGSSLPFLVERGWERFLREPACDDNQQVKIFHLRWVSRVTDVCLP